MFPSQERGAAEKRFQKPNILRRKTKVTKRNIKGNIESFTLSSTNSDLESALLPVVQANEIYNQALDISQAPSPRLASNNEVCGHQGGTFETIKINGGESLTIYAHGDQGEGSGSCLAQSVLNVESFLNNGSTVAKEKMLHTKDSPNTVATGNKQKWCLSFARNSSKDTVATSYYGGSQISNNVYINDSSIVCTLSIPAENQHLIESSVSKTNMAQPPTPINLDTVTTKYDSAKKTEIFECDVPNCNKTFRTVARLQSHKNVHNKPKTFPVLHCPVKRTDSEGVETQCQRTFQVRNQLMKHLNDEHSPEDALFKCTNCGRRFYWAYGARLHQANGCARTFKCAWAGCERVFRQQCRLREHARAHTGDRPYPCHYQECGWAFRSASKLMRHVRRHTGERRHACVTCGHAFPRAEHLRDHTARFHAPAASHLPCTHTGCDQKFPSRSTLHTHLRNAHKEHTSQLPKKQKKPKRERFVLQSMTPLLKIDTIKASTERMSVEMTEPTSVEASSSREYTSLMEGVTDVCGDGDEDGRCARTHCTWPLRRDTDYALEEHAQVEQSESCESNIYTVRSDLFLHGNLLINEDSEFIISRAVAGGDAAAGEGGESTLGLIDSHPTGDLTQEELMYADAVDESSFRVLLLNGEELA